MGLGQEVFFFSQSMLTLAQIETLEAKQAAEVLKPSFSRLYPQTVFVPGAWMEYLPRMLHSGKSLGTRAQRKGVFCSNLVRWCLFGDDSLYSKCFHMIVHISGFSSPILRCGAMVVSNNVLDQLYAGRIQEDDCAAVASGSLTEEEGRCNTDSTGRPRNDCELMHLERI